MQSGRDFPSRWKLRGGTGSIKGRFWSSVGLPLEEADISRLLPMLETEEVPRRAEEQPDLPEPSAVRGTEKPMGLPLALYPEEMEDPRRFGYIVGGRLEVAQGQPTPAWLHCCQTPSQHIVAGFLADPVAEHSATVRALVWDPVESGGPGSPYPLPPPLGVAASPS